MRKTTKRICLGALATALAMSMGASVAYAANASDTDSTQLSTFDLRHYNGTIGYDSANKRSTVDGGINYVTPVKNQNPFNSCWSFSVTSAAETSMLTSLDKADDGKMNGTVDYDKAASGAAGDIAYAASDLSERHLAVSAFSHAKSTGMYSDQAGEGRYLVSGDTDGASVMDVGGMPLAGISVFSCGIGPMPESVAPYISDEGYIQGCLPVIANPTTGAFKTKQFTDYNTAVEYLNKVWTKDAINAFTRQVTGEDASDEAVEYYLKNMTTPTLSKKGTWGLDSTVAYGYVAELSNSNLLETTSGDGLDSTEIASMKEELTEGRPVSIAYRADQSHPGDVLAGNTYINTDTWAHYTYEAVGINHGVTIVGWDDNYDKSNFTHNIYKTEVVEENGQKVQKIVRDEKGNPVVDEEATARTTPSHNGAWIVKNSWGYSDDSNPLTRASWGVDGTGYFYLSYEDKSVTSMESYEFDLSQEAQAKTGCATAQYDTAKCTRIDTISYSPDSEYKTCNVFGSDDDEGTGDPYTLRDVGFLTGVAGDTVTIDVYVMNAGADVESTIAKNKPVASQTETFTYGGFHRITLKDAPVIKSNQKVAVVQTTKQPSGKYECAFFYEFNEDLADASGGTFYTKTVVNSGESMEYKNGTWTDWASEAKAMGDKAYYDANAAYIAAGLTTEEEVAADIAKGYSCVVDNFSIKLYADPITVTANGLKLAKSSWTVKSKKGGTTTISAKNANGKVTYKAASKKITVNAKGKVTVKKGTKTGTYKVKVTAAGDTTHKAATKTFTVKVK